MSEPLPATVRAAAVGARDVRDEFTVIVEHLRPDLLRVARAAGLGPSAEDVVSDTIARHFGRVLADPPATLTAPASYQHLRASLIVSVRNAARNWHRDHRRTIPLGTGEVAALIGANEASPAHDALIFDAEDTRALREALSRLDPADAEVVRLVGLEACTVRAAAAELGLPKSTVQDTWRRVQVTLRASVDRYLDGGYCAEYAPHLALLDAQRRAQREGSDERPLDEVVGSERSEAIARHVYGTSADGDGCHTCRLTRIRQRAALRAFLPVPVLPPAGGSVLDATRDALHGMWDGACAAIGRLTDEISSCLVGGGGSAVGLGGSKAAAWVTAATLTVGAATVTPVLTNQRPSRPTAPAVHSTAGSPGGASASGHAASGAPAGRRIAPRAVAPRAAAPPRARSRGSTGAGSAAAEFTPGP